MKKFSVVLLIILVLGTVVSMPLANVFAAYGEQKHTDYVDITSGGTVTRGPVNQSYSNHKIEYGPTTVNPDHYSNFVKIQVTLKKKGLIGYSNKGYAITDIYQPYILYSSEIAKNVGSGTFKYEYTTKLNGYNTGSLVSLTYLYSNS